MSIVYLTCAKNENGPTMNRHKFINYEVESKQNKFFIPIEEENKGMLDGKMMQFIMNPLKKLKMCKLVMWWSIE